MGLLGGVVDGGDAISQHGGHHHVHGGAHADLIHIDAGALQAAVPGHGLDKAALGDLGAHSAKALHVQVDGPHAEVAAAGHGHGGLAKPAQQRAHQIVAGADAAGQLIGRPGGVDAAAVQLHGVAVQDADLGAQFLQNGEEQRHVADLRHVFDADNAVHQQGGGDNGNGGVLGAADGNLAKQGMTAADHVLIHNRYLSSNGESLKVSCPPRFRFMQKNAMRKEKV